MIAFVGNPKTGQTEIEKLSHENSRRALMAGVISRSAYIYAHTPRHDVEKSKLKTDLDLCPTETVSVRGRGGGSSSSAVV